MKQKEIKDNLYPHLTAIKREYLSFPAKYLSKQNLLQGKILDFGCGYGKDVEILTKKGLDIQGYDRYYFPQYPQERYDRIICIYVLNVLFESEQEEVIMSISQLLKPTGKAYFAVRRDLKTEGFRQHYVHKKPTYQRFVELPFQSIYADEFCEIYEYSPYNQRTKYGGCIFCQPHRKLTLLTESSIAYAILDGYPLTKGHSLIIPKQHVEDYFELPFSLQSHCWQMVNQVKQIITAQYQPDGFNIGFNVNHAGGQRVKHTHIHLIPRYRGDNRGKKHGIRCVLPSVK